MRFEWDEAKNRLNIEKHGVSFEQAALIFDGFTVDRIDSRFDYGESRELSIGLLQGVAVLVVVHTDRDGVCRIISARQARKDERKRYEQAVRQATDG
jgi:uncharacterized DUF497 family protein